MCKKVKESKEKEGKQNKGRVEEPLALHHGYGDLGFPTTPIHIVIYTLDEQTIIERDKKTR